MPSIYVYILVSALTVYLIRLLPMVIFKKPITNKFINSFLYYVPFVTLSVMTVPAIFYVSSVSIWAGISALIFGIVTAYFTKNLFIVASVCSVTVLILSIIL